MAQYVLQQLSNLTTPVTVEASSVEIPRISSLDEAVHELRQPLSVIESLAYYLELTSENEVACAHLRRIQAMVEQANQILAQVSELCQPAAAWQAESCC